MTSLLHHTVEGPVADDRMSSFPPACCCWQGSCREGLRRWGGRRGGRGPVGARSLPCGAAQRSCSGGGPPFPCRGAAPCRLLLVAGGGGWCWCGAATHAERSVAACKSTNASANVSTRVGLGRVQRERAWFAQAGSQTQTQAQHEEGGQGAVHE